MKTILIFTFGFLSGLVCYSGFNQITTQTNSLSYFELEKDYCLGEVGLLKKGTIIKFDQGFPEGFFTCVLYLNYSASSNLEKHFPKNDAPGLIIPYWAEADDDDKGCLQ